MAELRFGQPPAPIGQSFQYTVNVLGRLTQVEQFEDIVVKTGADGAVTRLKDIARIELGGRSYNVVSRLNGAISASVAVYQLPGANALDVAKRVRAAMTELSAGFPPGLEYTVPYDTTIFVEPDLKGEVDRFGNLIIERKQP